MCCIMVVTILYGLRLQNPINYSLSGFQLELFGLFTRGEKV